MAGKKKQPPTEQPEEEQLNQESPDSGDGAESFANINPQGTQFANIEPNK